jgi:Fe2+ or Zn2+ uptake regulation protein
MRLTNKQISVLNAVKEGNKAGEACTVYDLIESVPYDCTRDGLLHTMKTLIDKGLVERLGREQRDGTLPNQTFGLTPAGLDLI